MLSGPISAFAPDLRHVAFINCTTTDDIFVDDVSDSDTGSDSSSESDAFELDLLSALFQPAGGAAEATRDSINLLLSLMMSTAPKSCGRP